MKTYIIKLSVLTPLNIGTGIVKDPLSFMIRKDGNKYEYISFDLEKYIEKGQDRKELLKILENNSYREIINFLMSKDIEADYSMPASKEAHKIYTAKLESKGKMIPEVIPMMRNPVDFKPFIPGSSIKGAIRTSILNSLINKKNYDVDRKISKEIEQYLLGFSEKQPDPLKYLSVSDCKIEDGNFQKLYAFKVFKDGEFRNDLSNIVECLKKDAIGEFTISIDEKLKEFSDISKITEAINTTHRNILGNEIQRYKEYFKDNVKNKFNEIYNLFKGLKENQAMMRIGRHTQKEYKIFENKEPNKYGKTRVLAESVLPPGWVQILLLEDIK